MADDERPRVPGAQGFEYLQEAKFGPVGALLARSRIGDPLKGFNPDAFGDGAYEEAEPAESAERSERAESAARAESAGRRGAAAEAKAGKGKRRWRFWR